MVSLTSNSDDVKNSCDCDPIGNTFADNYRDNYYKIVFDFLKFTTAFVVAYLAWFFTQFSDFSHPLVYFAAVSGAVSGLLGMAIILGILNFYNNRLTTTRCHESGSINGQKQSPRVKEHRFLDNIPTFVYSHVGFLFVSVLLIVTLKIGDFIKTAILFGSFVIASLLIVSILKSPN